MVGRDLLALAQSYLCLGEAESQAGHPHAIPPLHGQLIKVLDEFKRRALSGVLLPYQSRELGQIENLAKLLLMSAGETSPADRIAALDRLVQFWDGPARDQPDNLTLRFKAAERLLQLAELEIQNSQVAEARASLDRAFPMLKDTAKAEPENLRFRHGLARAWETLGRVQARAGRKTEARDAATKAVDLGDELSRIDAAYSYDLACSLSLRGAVSASQADATAAIAALRRAIEAGFDNAHLLRTDPRLKSLRSRPDFPVLNAVRS